jgi:hypothetical protein
MLSLAFVAAALVAIGRMTTTRPDTWAQVFGLELALLAAMVVLSCLAAWWVHHRGWRTWYTLVAVGEGLLALIALHTFLQLQPLESLEVLAIILGVILLGVGHAGWYREHERENDVVSLSLAFGSILVAMPLAVAVVAYRWAGQFHVPDEAGALAAIVVLLGGGFMCRIKSTTLVGVLLGLVYLFSLGLFVRVPTQLQSAAVGIGIGGAALFVIGLLLSIYRESLLDLPEKIRRREGVFRILTWR